VQAGMSHPKLTGDEKGPQFQLLDPLERLQERELDQLPSNGMATVGDVTKANLLWS